MLVITRRAGQSLLIGIQGIEVKILEITQRQVKVGIVAPREVRVLRDELERQGRED
jgi:carbon storage regulator